MDIPEWKDCPKCIELGMPTRFRQGMVLEENYHDEDLNPIDPPYRWYRCQDCPHVEEITDER